MGGGGGGNGGRLVEADEAAEPGALDADAGAGVRAVLSGADAALGRASCAGTPLAAGMLPAPDAAIAAVDVRGPPLGVPRAPGSGGSLAPLPASAANWMGFVRWGRCDKRAISTPVCCLACQ